MPSSRAQDAGGSDRRAIEWLGELGHRLAIGQQAPLLGQHEQLRAVPGGRPTSRSAVSRLRPTSAVEFSCIAAERILTPGRERSRAPSGHR